MPTPSSDRPPAGRKQTGAADIVLTCGDLASAIDFYTKRLEFRIDAIFPADAPRIVKLSGHGLMIRLELGDDPAGPRSEPERFVPGFHLQRGGDDAWGEGRAGMQYRDLVPGRLGGRYIASHIRIPDGGPVPDYVHHHDVCFQMIYCYRGWVKVVYEDQGPPFVMHPGDCVLQPPHIRHRVLECSDGMEVIEISCPAEHETRVDHDLPLPTDVLDPQREFDGQRFVLHRSHEANWYEGPFEGFEVTDLGIGAATHGLASARVIRSSSEDLTARLRHDGELSFAFVLSGSATIARPSSPAQPIARGDAFVVPPGTRVDLVGASTELEMLLVDSPGTRP